MRHRAFSKPRVGIVGLGHMGLATGLAFAARGLNVIGHDLDPEVRRDLERGSAPYREAGLEELLREQQRARRFRVVRSTKQLVDGSDVIFLCVPSPSNRLGRIDLRPLMKSVSEIGSDLRTVREYRVIVVKSTVVPGTTVNLVSPTLRRDSQRPATDIGVASNPEFLSEGTMVRDAVHPSRIVLGTNDARSLTWLRRTYLPFRAPVISLTPTGAELVKYSANAFLALKVSFANEVARFAEALGVSVDAVLQGVGRDERIGSRFLSAGPGFGGSCLEKDLRALVTLANDLGINFRSGEAALRINAEQLKFTVRRIREVVGPLSGKKLALLGLSFKAGTDDVRGSRALYLAHELVSAGAAVVGHDPVAIDNFREAWKTRYARPDGKIELRHSVMQALDGADAAILHTDWPMYAHWRSEWSRKMARPLLLDLRRLVKPSVARKTGLLWYGLGDGGSTDPMRGGNGGVRK